jgi:hypothetical protein
MDLVDTRTKLSTMVRFLVLRHRGLMRELQDSRQMVDPHFQIGLRADTRPPQTGPQIPIY